MPQREGTQLHQVFGVGGLPSGSGQAPGCHSWILAMNSACPERMWGAAAPSAGPLHVLFACRGHATFHHLHLASSSSSFSCLFLWPERLGTSE